MKVVAAELLFSSLGSVGSLTLATFVIAVPGLVPESIWRTRVKTEVLLAGSALFEQLIVPPDPTDGVEQDHDTPEFCTKETNVVFAGTVSVMLAALAWSGPLLTTVIVYVMSVSAAAWAGPVFVTERSAVDGTVPESAGNDESTRKEAVRRKRLRIFILEMAPQLCDEAWQGNFGGS